MSALLVSKMRRLTRFTRSSCFVRVLKRVNLIIPCLSVLGCSYNIFVCQWGRRCAVWVCSHSSFFVPIWSLLAVAGRAPPSLAARFVDYGLCDSPVSRSILLFMHRCQRKSHLNLQEVVQELLSKWVRLSWSRSCTDLTASIRVRLVMRFETITSRTSVTPGGGVTSLSYLYLPYLCYLHSICSCTPYTRTLVVICVSENVIRIPALWLWKLVYLALKRGLFRPVGSDQ